MSNKCVMCGANIPEGSLYCYSCGISKAVESLNKLTALKIRIKYHDPEMERLYKIENGDWIDMRAAERVAMNKGDYRLISLGVSMQLPKGYEAHIAPRSSTFKNFGIVCANSIGIIDESYCGDNDIWHFPAIAKRNTVINKGDRICQFRIVEKMPRVTLIEVETLGNADRGGIGSTGIR